MKIGSIEMDANIIKALRDHELVIFAGAGVSMGAPSNLPSFEELSKNIARGTGCEPRPPWDQLLGRLQCKGVKVHQLAADALSLPESSYNDLHFNLIRLFRSRDSVRLITTNFDFHFENAAKELFVNLPDIYQAPALPLGKDFNGIVHVHGSINRPGNMVLTDADFGKAYLTEGWARRFLLEVFQNYTVLFVGYSYDDIVMQYLARALPAKNEINRFVLIEKPDNLETLDKWANLGINPIVFNISDSEEKYVELYCCIEKLANRFNRGVFDWESRITEICKGASPIDDEVIGEIDQVLSEGYTTRFFVKAARDIKWPKWLYEHKYLEALFRDGELNEREKIIASWLASEYAVEHPSVIIDIFAVKGIQMNPILWIEIVRILINDEIDTSESVLCRWIPILLDSAPPNINSIYLVKLTERCSEESTIFLVLRIFHFISEHQLTIRHGLLGSEETDDEHGYRHYDLNIILRANHWSLNKIWREHLKSYLAIISQSLLSGIIQQFEKMFFDLKAWGKASRTWDMSCLRRSAIEPHPQDDHPEPIDVLIDAARDTLEFLSMDVPILLESWCERLIVSEVPLLRRLAIHAITQHPNMTADVILSWLLNNISLISSAEHHEIYRALQIYYPKACSDTRKQIVDTILSYKKPAREDRSEEESTARTHFDLLSWLIKAMPDCPFAKEALSPITVEYPQLRLLEHPDFISWMESGGWGSTSPWSVEQLLSIKPDEKIEEFLSYKGDTFDGPDRDGLMSDIREACKQDVSWASALVEALTEKAQWDSDIWPSIIRGLQETDISERDYVCILIAIARPELYTYYSYFIADFLNYLVKDGGKPFALKLLDETNKAALDIWEFPKTEDYDGSVTDWIQSAINTTEGEIVEYWLHGLSLLMKQRARTERNIPEYYSKLFEQIIIDPTVRGGMGRCILASQTPFLYGIDEAWVRNNIIPLFSQTNSDIFSQAWHGFIEWGNLYNVSLAEEMLPTFISAVKRLDELLEHRDRFIEFYTNLAVFIVDDPADEIIPKFFNHGTLHDRVHFASHLGFMLRQMKSETLQSLWNRWLKKYWEQRLNGIPIPLEAQEIEEMLMWLPLLDDAFCDAISLAIRMPITKIDNTSMLFELKESDLVIRFQEECAKLLIYLCRCVEGYSKEGLLEIADRLKEIPSELDRQLRESLALIGLC